MGACASFRAWWRSDCKLAHVPIGATARSHESLRYLWQLREIEVSCLVTRQADFLKQLLGTLAMKPRELCLIRKFGLSPSSLISAAAALGLFRLTAYKWSSTQHSSCRRVRVEESSSCWFKGIFWRHGLLDYLHFEPARNLCHWSKSIPPADVQSDRRISP